MMRLLPAPTILACLAAVAAAQDEKPTLRVPADGETVTVDLAALKPFLEKRPKDGSDFVVRWAGKDVERKDKAAWKVEIAGVKPAEDAEISITLAKMTLKIAVRTADQRRAISGRTEGLGEEGAWLSVCDTGEGSWTAKSADERFPAFAKGKVVTLDGMGTKSFTPLVKGSKGAFYAVTAKSLKAWLDAAQLCYDSILKQDYASYTSTFVKAKQESANRNAECQMYWRAGTLIIEKNDVKKYVFSRIRKSETTSAKRCLLFKRLNAKDEQVGFETLITVVYEDGKWLVDQVSP